MACTDFTEQLTIRLDHEYRVTDYSLLKNTCGADLGGKSLLRRWMKGKSAEHLLNMTVQEVLAMIPSRSDLWEYLTVKHFLAVQGCLAVVTGQCSGCAADWCRLESIECDPEFISVRALIRIERITKEIRACRADCGRKKL